MPNDDAGDEELFSMEDLEKDLKRGRGAKRLPWLTAGLLIGVAGTIAVPRLLGPYLPAVFSGGSELLSGPVLAEERDGERLLLTLATEPGALIASFSERVAEIALLVEPGDTVTIAVEDYDPFIVDPDFEGVRKARPGGATTPEVVGPAGARDPAASGDTAASSDTAASGDTATIDDAEAGVGATGGESTGAEGAAADTAAATDTAAAPAAADTVAVRRS